MARGWSCSAAGLTIEEGDRADEAYLLDKVGGCEAIIVRGGTFQINQAVIGAASSCVVIGRHGVGLDCIDVQAASAAGIPVVFAPGSNSTAVAEHAVTLMLTVAKKIWEASVHFRVRGNYDYRLKVAGVELTGRTLGIIGLGGNRHNIAK
jgi:D-3-phosphoglycerate dehydrogenase